jgi:hypothetical protein
MTAASMKLIYNKQAESTKVNDRPPLYGMMKRRHSNRGRSVAGDVFWHTSSKKFMN